MPEWQRQIYQSVGGAPHLDQNYTVYGEVVKGLEMVDFIAEVTTDKNNRPKEDIKMMVSVLSKRDIRKLEKELAKKRVK